MDFDDGLHPQGARQGQKPGEALRLERGGDQQQRVRAEEEAFVHLDLRDDEVLPEKRKLRPRPERAEVVGASAEEGRVREDRDGVRAALLVAPELFARVHHFVDDAPARGRALDLADDGESLPSQRGGHPPPGRQQFRGFFGLSLQDAVENHDDLLLIFGYKKRGEKNLSGFSPPAWGAKRP